MLSRKQKALGFFCKETSSLRMYLTRLYLLKRGHSRRMWCRVSSCASLHGHELTLPGKNLALYLPVGAWLVISRVTRAQMEFDIPMVLSQLPPLI